MAGASLEAQAALLDQQPQLVQSSLATDEHIRARIESEARLHQLTRSDCPTVRSLPGYPAAVPSSVLMGAAAPVSGQFAKSGIGKLNNKEVADFLNHSPPMRATATGLSLLDDPVIRAARDTGAKRSAKSDSDISGSSRKDGSNKNLDGPQAKILFIEGDEEYLTEYQCLLRKQLEVFEAGPTDLRGSTQGRNTPIMLGQVGLRCRHCANLPLAARTKGAVYYSQTIDGVYQIAQNMSKVHLCQRCYRIPPEVQAKLLDLKRGSRRATGGKEYWAKALRTMGVYEDGKVLRMRKRSIETLS